MGPLILPNLQGFVQAFCFSAQLATKAADFAVIAFIIGYFHPGPAGALEQKLTVSS